MLDILTKILGLIAGFYVLKGMLGKGRSGDFTRLLLVLAVFLGLIVFKNGLI